MPVKIVTMADIDAARNKLSDVITRLRDMQGKGYVSCLYNTVAASRQYWEEQVTTLLRDYHHQRSPDFLLGLLKHVWGCPSMVTDQPCESCNAVRLLSKEVP